MGEDTRTDGTAVSDGRDPQEIRDEIDDIRRELGATAAALMAKTDVKRQAQQRVSETKASVAHRAEDVLGRARQTSPRTAVSASSRISSVARENPAPVAAAGAFAAGVLVGAIAGRKQ